MNNKYQKIIEILGKDRVRLNEPMSTHTTFKIGGPADLFYEATNEEDLIKAVKLARENEIPFLLIGGGSNLLVGDGGYRGIIIKCLISNFKFLTDDGKVLVSIGAGMMTSALINELTKNSISGLEFMAGVPGTVGGAIRGNARAWQQNIGDKVLRVKVITEDGEVKWIVQKDCEFGYKESRFKHTGEIILEVEFSLAKGDRQKSGEEIKIFLEKRKSQPNEPSAGCIFINPPNQVAGALIDQCGLKGMQIGGAKISEKHANFFVNVGGAKAADVITLINLAKAKVKEKFGIDLKEEIVRIGEF